MKKKNGVSLRLVHSILTFVSLAFAVAVIITTSVAENGHEEISKLTDGYVRCTNDILAMDETSDYLTSRVREYVALGKKEDAEKYVAEIAESKTREKALENVKTYFANTVVYDNLEATLRASNALETTELYAMKLASAFYGPDQVPSKIFNVTLLDEDVALSDESKRDKAMEMVFGEDYKKQKLEIDSNAQECLNNLIKITEERKKSANDSVVFTMTFHEIVGALLLINVAVAGILTGTLVFSPLRKAKTALTEGRKIEVEGCSEVRFVTNSYNEVFDANEHKKEILQFEVSHDILTGIPNRHDYVANCNRLAKDKVIYIIADVDHFKEINDTFGHAMGDTVLSEVARRLREAFLNHDRVFRIGGDEFVVMVFDTDDKRRLELKKTLKNINEVLHDLHKDNSFPLVSISFGVTMKEEAMSFEDAYRQADKALYSVKKKAGCDFAFYSELDSKLKE